MAGADRARPSSSVHSCGVQCPASHIPYPVGTGTAETLPRRPLQSGRSGVSSQHLVCSAPGFLWPHACRPIEASERTWAAPHFRNETKASVVSDMTWSLCSPWPARSSIIEPWSQRKPKICSPPGAGVPSTARTRLLLSLLQPGACAGDSPAWEDMSCSRPSLHTQETFTGVKGNMHTPHQENTWNTSTPQHLFST